MKKNQNGKYDTVRQLVFILKAMIITTTTLMTTTVLVTIINQQWQ